MQDFEQTATALDDDSDTIFLDLADVSEESPTPLLDELGVDLTLEAREGRLALIRGRGEEMGLLIETLCRCTKRNPVLVGPAGVGKTAIVEGLAARVASGEIPWPLRDMRIISLPVSALVGGCKFVGEFEERMTKVLREASTPGVVLFIDEAHTMIGAGAAGKNGNDLANLLKPALSRGDICCIAATTEEEYRRFIEGDSAFERRFQLIRVREMTPGQTLEILSAQGERLRKSRGVSLHRSQLEWLINFAEHHLTSRFFPDKAVDLLEQCVSFAILQGMTELRQHDLETVALRMAGLPRNFDERLLKMRGELRARTMLPNEAIDALAKRLAITLRDLDLNVMRPNAVMLLANEAASQGEIAGDVIAECLFGEQTRVAPVDFGRISTPADMSVLLGAAPGYVGHGGRVALHGAAEMSCCVLRCDGLEACHPLARDVLARALQTGFITLADGKRVALSDMVVILTADLEEFNRGPLGFETKCSDESCRPKLAPLLGEALLEQVDILCAEIREGEAETTRWLRDSLARTLRDRCRAHGVNLEIDEAVYTWLASRAPESATQTDWERLIEQELCPLILPHLAGAGGGLRVVVEDGGVVCLNSDYQV